MSDRLHTFLFERFPVRGALVQLGAAWRAIRDLRPYPVLVERLLGESVVASALLASTLKRSSGSLLMQIQGEGPIRLLVAECAADFGLRCTARWLDPVAPAPLGALFGRGRCAITVGGGDGGPLYQGIVPLESASLAQALDRYMERSEQIRSRMWLFADGANAAGLLLQRIPGVREADEEGFDRAVLLGATVTGPELFALSAPEVLRRLFAEDDVRLFSGRGLAFRCTCTSERVRNMLVMQGREEVEQVLAEQGRIEVTCEFCNRTYAFSPGECRQWFGAAEC